MATQRQTAIAPFGSITILRIVNFFDIIKKSYKRWNLRRQTRNELYNLNPRELDDIGISRADIERICKSM